MDRASVILNHISANSLGSDQSGDIYASPVEADTVAIQKAAADSDDDEPEKENDAAEADGGNAPAELEMQLSFNAETNEYHATKYKHV